jgi:hypothetical protein
MDEATQTRVHATRYLKALVPKIVALSGLMEQHKLEIQEEVFVHAVLILHRILPLLSNAVQRRVVVTVCCVLGCKLAIDDDVLAPRYTKVVRSLFDQPRKEARTFAMQEMEVLKLIDFQCLKHMFIN